jgi:hypothetical protein
MKDSRPNITHSFRDKLNVSGTKKLLALDGGGIRGLITIEILAGVEAVLRQVRSDPQLVLAEYFDYIGGTSTGAIIATCIALGMPMDRVRSFYVNNGTAMFDKSSLLKRFRYKYEDEKLAAMLRAVLREQAETAGISGDPTLGSEALRTLLLVVMRNATTDSPWPISNNPAAKYNARNRDDCNLDIPLWQLVRASTAAPVYFPPEQLRLGQREFLFVDGGLTTYNNPSFLLFLMSTIGAYRLGWSTGEDKMLLLSIGTGTSPKANEDLEPSDMNLLYNAASVPSALMYAALNEQDMLCRVFGTCRFGADLDREVGSLIDSADRPSRGILPKLFTYARYNAELTLDALSELGLPYVRPEHVQKLDSVEHMDQLQQIGRAVGAKVTSAHFEGFLA